MQERIHLRRIRPPIQLKQGDGHSDTGRQEGRVYLTDKRLKQQARQKQSCTD